MKVVWSEEVGETAANKAYVGLGPMAVVRAHLYYGTVFYTGTEKWVYDARVVGATVNWCTHAPHDFDTLEEAKAWAEAEIAVMTKKFADALLVEVK